MPRTALWLLGGVFCAYGILNLLFSFGTPWGPINLNLDSVGWDAVADIAPTTNAPVALMCVLVGLPVLVWLNATAWKETDGY